MTLILAGVPEKLGGAICMHYDETQGRGHFLWTHTTSSMGLAYQTTADTSATTVMSRINNVPKTPGGTCILVESVPFATKLTAANGHTNGHCSFDEGTSNSSAAKIQSAKA